MAITDPAGGRGALDLQDFNGRVFGQRGGSGSDFTDILVEMRTLIYSHTHASATTGSQLDWDNIFSDAVHDHSSDAEGGTLSSSALPAYSVLAADLSTDAVTNPKIADYAVDTAELNTDAVTSPKIADFAVLTANINTDAVTPNKLSEAALRRTEGTYIGTLSASTNMHVFHAPCYCSIAEVTVSVDTTVAISNTDYWQAQVANMTQSNDLLSAATDTIGVAITADTVRTLGPDQNTTLNTDDVLELQLTKVASGANLGGLYVAVRWSPAE